MKLEQQLTMAVLKGEVTKARFIRSEIAAWKYIREQREAKDRKQIEQKGRPLTQEPI